MACVVNFMTEHRRATPIEEKENRYQRGKRRGSYGMNCMFSHDCNLLDLLVYPYGHGSWNLAIGIVVLVERTLFVLCSCVHTKD